MVHVKVSRLTYADLEQLPPDEGKRYELIDGELFVTASPNLAHQRAVRGLFLLLNAARGPEVEVLFAPFDWYVDEYNVYEPDLLVARIQDSTERYLPRPPLLAAEVLSPSTRSRDLVRKRYAYEQAGLSHYWIVDPLLPAVTILERQNGRLVETLAVKGEDTVTIERPFPIVLCPGDLLA
jgi:Uma2 family endonuclease